MQVIRGLLKLQSVKINDHTLLKAFQETENRIRSMALVHQKLYQSKDLSKIDLKSYIEDLAKALFESYKVDTEHVSLSFNLESFFLSIYAAIPYGLIINEIISNSLKYAFPNNRKGIIHIQLKNPANRHLELTIRDNGIGLSEDIQLHEAQTLGMQLIHELSEKQLGGRIILNKSGGTKYKIIIDDTPN
jgi:two-component sensor histidine kinase